jgi:hypothetical protein
LERFEDVDRPPIQPRGNLAIVEHRRTLVSRFALHGLTKPEIADALFEMGHYNPETQEAWSVDTVARDIKIIRDKWIDQSTAAYSDLVAEMLAQYREVRRVAWVAGDLDVVLKCCDRECRLLGLDQPDQLIVNWRQEAQAAGIDSEDVFEDVVERAMALLESGGEASG